MPKSKKKSRPNVWTGSPYGEYHGPKGNPNQWRQAFKETMGEDEARDILGEDNPWGVLGLQPGASLDEVKSAFRKYAKKWHPDHCDAANAADMFRHGMAAYTLLMGKVK